MPPSATPPRTPVDTESILFADIAPYTSSWLQVSPLHHIYFEQCGNPNGTPIVFLHGGPGSGCNPKQRRFFDPEHYRIILFDQRGCGRSLPLGCTIDNTTADLVTDIEVLREHLGISRWLVFGGSWGSTLALSYAATHTHRVTGLILRGIFLARPSELDWFIYHADQFFPEVYERFVEPIPAEERKDILSAYQRRIFDADASVHIPAAHTWNAYEASIMSLLPSGPASTETPDAVLLARARVQIHFLVNHCFLLYRPLLGEIDRLRSIPCTIIQGRYDMVCPPETAYALYQAWPEASFSVIPDAGHSAMESGIASTLVAATESFKTLQI